MNKTKVVGFESPKIIMDIKQENGLYTLTIQEGDKKTVVTHDTIESALDNFHELIEDKGGIRA